MRVWCLSATKAEWKAACLALLLAAASSGAAAQFGDRSGSSSPFGSAQPQFLPVDEAFSFDISLDSDEEITVHWRIAPEYYLYQDKFDFRVIDQSSSELDTRFSLPEGRAHTDEFFGDVVVYHDAVAVSVTLPDLESRSFVLQIDFQGCAEAGLCYPPQTRHVEILH